MQHCLKQIVKATIVHTGAPNIDARGTLAVGYNDINNEVSECPRKDMPTGEGYHLCKEVCDQQGHAEIQALRQLEERYGKDFYDEDCKVIIEGHTYACDACKQALYRKGITEIEIR
jgi:deoxycytidylate deaminase